MEPCRSLFTLAVLAALALPSSAAAEIVTHTKSGLSDLRAGPGIQYPVIAEVSGGSRVYVTGCIEDYSWCEVSAGALRGWMSIRRIEATGGVIGPDTIPQTEPGSGGRGACPQTDPRCL